MLNTINRIEQDIQRLTTCRDVLLQLAEKLPNSLEAAICGNGIDFDNLSHANVILVIGAIGGRWVKTPSDDGRIHYTREEQISGVTLRCWAGEPPPGCKVVEEEVRVEAQFIPAYTKTVRKLQCPQAEPPEGSEIIESTLEHEPMPF